MVENSVAESVKSHRGVMWVWLHGLRRSENQIASILHISEEEAVIFQKLLFLDPDPFRWIFVHLSRLSYA